MTDVDSDKQMTPMAQPSGPMDTGRVAAEVALQQVSRQARAMSLLKQAALLPALVLLIIVGAVVSPVFFSVSNFSGIGLQASALGVTDGGEALILLIGGMDLSLGGTYGFAPMFVAWLIVPASAYGAGYELNPYLGILILPPDRGLHRLRKQHSHCKGAPKRLHNHSRDADPPGRLPKRHRES